MNTSTPGARCGIALTDNLAGTEAELTTVRQALDFAADFFRAHAPCAGDAGIERASEDPHLILLFGQLLSRLHAAQELLAKARRLAGIDSTKPVQTGSNEQAAAAVAAIEARAFASDLMTDAISRLVALGCHTLPYRNSHATPVVTSPTPVANHWNYHFAGNYHLKGVVPPSLAVDTRTKDQIPEGRR